MLRARESVVMHPHIRHGGIATELTRLACYLARHLPARCWRTIERSFDHSFFFDQSSRVGVSYLGEQHPRIFSTFIMMLY